ncbi:MAG TPA: hypothetical protein VGG30_04960 [Pirellulales bacterium]
MEESKIKEFGLRALAVRWLLSFAAGMLFGSVAIPIALTYWHPLGASIPTAVMVIGAVLALVSLALAYLLRQK